MRNAIKNCLATTAVALLLLSMIATLYQGHFLCIETVFQVFFSNVIIHVVLYALKRFESKYYMVEILLETGSVILIILVSGYFFQWYESLPGWVLAIMGIITYIVGCFIGLFHMNRDIKVINQELQGRKHDGK